MAVCVNSHEVVISLCMYPCIVYICDRIYFLNLSVSVSEFRVWGEMHITRGTKSPRVMTGVHGAVLFSTRCRTPLQSRVSRFLSAIKLVKFHHRILASCTHTATNAPSIPFPPIPIASVSPSATLWTGAAKSAESEDISWLLQDMGQVQCLFELS